MNIVRLAAIVGRINPAAWDGIVPMGPISRAAEVELNPQPLPPHERQALVASVAAAHGIAQTVIAAAARGEKNPGQSVAEPLEDWCPTRPKPHPPGPNPWPWPHPWPGPWPPYRGPAEIDVAASQVVGALTLASIASRMTQGPARDALSHAAERLLAAGLES